MDYQDYYTTLGVAGPRRQAEIKKAFRKLAREHHPDTKPGDKAAERRFKEINEANAVLSDPEKRKKYDQLGSNWEAYAGPARGRAAGAAGNPFAGFAQGRPAGQRPLRVPHDRRRRRRGGFSDFFRMFFGGR